MKYLKIILFIGVLSIQVQNSHSVSASSELFIEEPINSVYAKEYLWNKNYRETIEYIKNHEGYRSNPYYCSAGVLTIGFGHAIMPNESFTKALNMEEAEALLIKDFNIALKAVERTTSIKGSKKLAIAHFIFSVGIGNFNRSTLKKLVLADKPINNTILLWSNYTNRNGDKVRSQVAYNIRSWELDMYYRDHNSIIMAIK
ncbi:MAG: lysozyme [Bacteroidales bacterium]|nr:lysozyme [Bacteroidales bacterium]